MDKFIILIIIIINYLVQQKINLTTLIYNIVSMTIQWNFIG